ncbi:hypothetical protein [Marinobacterium litorale]|uniref:hypothetical protein n=1 Tax=Marinobacterium litorale TaxID=404770 RepID=UPI000481308B|nr:hypothetical protein [Marinobacterium litorale]
MITETELWKEDIAKTANKLLKRLVQKKWSKRSWFCLEKELFIGFYAVRKLIESDNSLNKLSHKKYELLMFQRGNIIQDEFDEFVPYDHENSQKELVSVRDICNQFIHSHHLIPFASNNSLVGFLVNSEFQSKKGIYMITIFDIVEIYRSCAGREGLVDQKNEI